MRIFKCALVATLLLSLTGTVSSQTDFVVIARQAQRDTQVELDAKAHARLQTGVGTTRLNGVPLADGHTASYDLTGFSVFGPNSQIVVKHGAGEELLPVPAVFSWAGPEVGGKGYAIVTGSASELRIVAWSGEKSQPTFFVSEKGKTTTLAAGQAAPNDNSTKFHCSSDEVPENLERSRQALARLGAIPDPQTVGTGDIALIGLMIDVNNGLFTQAFGSNSTSAATYVANLVGVCSAIYNRDLKTVMRINKLTIWSTPDSFTGNSGSSQLSKYKAYVDGLSPSPERTVAHLLSNQLNYGGIAYVGALCDAGFGVGVSNLYGTDTYPRAIDAYSWDVNVVSHELGHNFGSPHTHCYTPPIDQCYTSESGCYNGSSVPELGTIMSYCHLVNSQGAVSLTFDPRCINETMRPGIQNAACAANCSSLYNCFVERQYLDFLKRGSDTAGRDYYVANLCVGSVSRERTISAFLSSPEFANVGGFVARCYFAIYNDNSVTDYTDPNYRIPDFDGFNYWISVIRSSSSEDAGRLTVAGGFMSSPEWSTRVGTRDNPGFVDFVYSNILGRAPDAAGRQYYIDLLDAGTLSRQAMIVSFLQAPETISKYSRHTLVTLAYAGMLNRAAERAGFVYHMGRLSSGTVGTESFLGEFVNSSEYVGRLNGLGCQFPSN